MIVTTRKNVFETNSSTNHTYTFSVHSKKECNSERSIVISGLLHKSSLIEWLFEESYFKTDSIYINGALLSKYFAMKETWDEGFLNEVKSLLRVCHETNWRSLYDELAGNVEVEEERYFRKADFRYQSYLEILAGGLIESRLPEEMRDTLRKKTALMLLGGFADDDLLKLFHHLKDGFLDLDDYLQIGILDGQSLSVEKLRYNAVCVIEKLSQKSISHIVESVGYIGFDGLLNDYYDFSVFTDELKLNLDSYAKFESSLKEFLTDDDIIVEAN